MQCSPPCRADAGPVQQRQTEGLRHNPLAGCQAGGQQHHRHQSRPSRIAGCRGLLWPPPAPAASVPPPLRSHRPGCCQHADTKAIVLGLSRIERVHIQALQPLIPTSSAASHSDTIPMLLALQLKCKAYLATPTSNATSSTRCINDDAFTFCSACPSCIGGRAI